MIAHHGDEVSREARPDWASIASGHGVPKCRSGALGWARALSTRHDQQCLPRRGRIGTPALRNSLARVRSCTPNALDRQRWTSREELRVAIVIWIERTDHRRRLQRGLGRLTPIEFELLASTAKAA
jgi:transposase InsO family protein